MKKLLCYVVLFGLFGFSFGDYIELKKPYEEMEMLQPNRILETKDGKGAILMSKSYYITQVRRSKDKKGYVYQKKDNNYTRFSNETKNAETIELTDKEVKLLEAYPMNSNQLFWDKERVIFKYDQPLYTYNNKVFTYGFYETKPFVPSSLNQDTDYIINNTEIILNYIDTLPYNKNLTNEENKIEIWNELKNTITYGSGENNQGASLQAFFDHQDDPKIVCQGIALLYGLAVNYLELDDVYWIRGDVVEANEPHAILKDDEGHYYDLTWDLNKKKLQYYKFNETLLSTYMTLSNGEVKYKESPTKKERIDLIKKDPYTYIDLHNTSSINMVGILDYDFYINTVLKSFPLKKADIILKDTISNNIKDLDIEAKTIVVLSRKDPFFLYHNYIKESRERAYESLSTIFKELSHQELQEFFIGIFGERWSDADRSQNKQQLLSSLYGLKISGIEFRFRVLDIVNQARQKYPNQPNILEREPKHIVIFKKRLDKTQLSKQRIKNGLEYFLKKYKNNEKVIEIITDWIRILEENN